MAAMEDSDSSLPNLPLTKVGKVSSTTYHFVLLGTTYTYHLLPLTNLPLTKQEWEDYLISEEALIEGIGAHS